MTTNPPLPEGSPAMIVHGGAWNIPPADREAHRVGCEAALARSYPTLVAGATALQAVEEAVVYLENEPTFDAGYGSVLNAAGFAELDAGVMDGRGLHLGAVAAVRNCANPVRLARAVLDSDHAMMVGDEAASALMYDLGMKPCDPDSLIVERERARWHLLTEGAEDPDAFFGMPTGTVGAVARDVYGNLAAATSTGGIPLKPIGRVGDSPIAGAGFYADNALAAVSATGAGEALLRLTWAFRAASYVGDGLGAQDACERAVALLGEQRASGGVIMIDRNGAVGVAFNTPAMGFAHHSGMNWK